MKATEEFDYGCVPEHADKLRRLAGVIEDGTKKLTQMAIVIGDAFLAAKAELDHGTFSKWCDAKTSYSPRQAEMYMNLAALFHRRDDDEDLCLLSVSAALELARPSVDEEVVTEILARARTGERLKVETVKDFVRCAKRNRGEPAQAPDRSPQMVDMITEALDIRQKESLLAFLGEKSGKVDQRFMKSLRSRLAQDLLKNKVRSNLLIAREWAAA